MDEERETRAFRNSAFPSCLLDADRVQRAEFDISGRRQHDEARRFGLKNTVMSPTKTWIPVEHLLNLQTGNMSISTQRCKIYFIEAGPNSLSTFRTLHAASDSIINNKPADKMVITNTLGANEVELDFVIVGGGTAGCVIASRLAEELPNKRIIVIEAGPSDWQDENILQLKNLLNLLGGDYDYNYTLTEQEFGENAPLLTSKRGIDF